MIEIKTKRLVKTRKEHECYGCIQLIQKGENAIAVKAQEDNKHIGFHLHEECNKVIVKDKWYSGSGLYYGCIKEAEEKEGESNLILTSDEALPFVR